MEQAEELQIMMDFYKEGDISAEEVEAHYQNTINHIEDFYESNDKTYSSFHYHVLIKKVK